MGVHGHHQIPLTRSLQIPTFDANATSRKRVHLRSTFQPPTLESTFERANELFSPPETACLALLPQFVIDVEGAFQTNGLCLRSESVNQCPF